MQTSCAIITKYHPATSLRGGSRISANAGKNRIYIPYPHELTGVEMYAEAARKLCEKLGWAGTLIAGGVEDGSYVFVFDECAKFAV